jgi:hypothetical protein
MIMQGLVMEFKLRRGRPFIIVGFKGRYNLRDNLQLWIAIVEEGPVLN